MVYYLEGSNIPGIMIYIRRIAFASEGKAKEFQRKYGGKVVTLGQALSES